MKLLTTLSLATLCLLCLAPRPSMAADPPTNQPTRQIAEEAYIYGYPLVTMEMTRRAMTNVPSPEGKLAPMGQFARLRSYPTPNDKEVTAPNADTLYTIAWLDVAKEPMILSLPDMKNRYYLMPMLSGYTDVFANPGTRTTGTAAQKYVITGPNWKGALPKEIKELKSPTAMVWILGRIYCTGTPEDYKAVHDLQNQCTLTPLSFYGKAYTPPVAKTDPALDTKTPVRDQVNAMNTTAYFQLLAQLMKENPPAPADAPMLAKMAQIGLTPGQFDASKLDPAIAQDLPKATFEKIMAHFKDAGAEINGWTFSLKTGDYGTDYLQRAFVTAVGLGANLPQDAIYPMCRVDADNKPLTGANTYTLHFAKGQLPPAKAFWSLTMYDDKMFFVPNSLNRYTLSSRSDFKTNPDGSIDMYLQKDPPAQAELQPNWLPAPNGPFVLTLRAYWPEEPLLNGTWKAPAVQRQTFTQVRENP